MLMEQPSRRPTVFDILRVSHEMSGTRPTIDYVSFLPLSSLELICSRLQCQRSSHPNQELLNNVLHRQLQIYSTLQNHPLPIHSPH
jgi:AP2-associated kinase